MTDSDHEKKQLLQLIIDQGILHDTPLRPILARDGKTRLTWVMNFLSISLQYNGLQIAARQLLTLLGTFEGRQLATIGTAAVPLLSACILESGGHYTGLMVRKERKGYGTGNLIDGRINHADPVIVIDDSIGSGTNMLECIHKLEQEGLYVEGCACLVRFGYDSGYALLQERGYRVVALFDQLQDISPHVPRDYRPPLYPVKNSFSQIRWDEQALPDYISPFQAIRDSIAHFWETGQLLRPPRCFNRPLDTLGGLSLSLRSQEAALTSWGRHGFWHFPEENDTGSTGDVSRAAWLLACQLREDPYRQQRLAQGALSLSLFGPLETCTEAGFDPTLHALVIRSAESPWKMGGGLPNMPGIQSANQLLYHLRFHNTRLRALEPFKQYRHTVEKLVEPGAEWPFGGTPCTTRRWDEQASIIQPIAQHLSGWVRQQQQQQDTGHLTPPEMYIPAGCQWLFLSVSSAGRLLACAGLPPHNGADLLRLVQAAAQDPRWQAMQGQTIPLTLRLYFLSEQTWLGETRGLEQIANFNLGEDAIAIRHEQQFSIILPDVPVHYGWNAAQLGTALYQKATIPANADQVHWLRYRCRKWQLELGPADTKASHCLLTDNQRQFPHPRSVPSKQGDQDKQGRQDYASFYRTFLLGHLHDNGQINGSYNPVLHQISQRQGVLTTARILYLLKEEAHTPAWQPAFDWLAAALSHQDLPTTERAYTLLALCGHPALFGRHRTLLAQQLEQLQAGFDTHGQYPGEGVVSGRQHASIELLALLQAQQAGFVMNNKLLDKATWYWLQQARYHALPDQYPLLLETLSLARMLLPAQADTIDTLLPELQARLLNRQLASGAFLCDQPHYPPALFTAEVVNGLCLSGLHDPAVAQAITQAMTWLHAETIRPEHADSFPFGVKAIGGIHHGLPNYHLLTVCSALALRAERMTEGGKA